MAEALAGLLRNYDPTMSEEDDKFPGESLRELLMTDLHAYESVRDKIQTMASTISKLENERRGTLATGVTGPGAGTSFDVMEEGLDVPAAAARSVSGLRTSDTTPAQAGPVPGQATARACDTVLGPETGRDPANAPRTPAERALLSRDPDLWSKSADDVLALHDTIVEKEVFPKVFPGRTPQRRYDREDCQAVYDKARELYEQLHVLVNLYNQKRFEKEHGMDHCRAQPEGKFVLFIDGAFAKDEGGNIRLFDSFEHACCEAPSFVTLFAGDYIVKPTGARCDKQQPRPLLLSDDFVLGTTFQKTGYPQKDGVPMDVENREKIVDSSSDLRPCLDVFLSDDKDLRRVGRDVVLLDTGAGGLARMVVNPRAWEKFGLVYAQTETLFVRFSPDEARIPVCVSIDNRVPPRPYTILSSLALIGHRALLLDKTGTLFVAPTELELAEWIRQVHCEVDKEQAALEDSTPGTASFVEGQTDDTPKRDSDFLDASVASAEDQQQPRDEDM